MNRVVVLCAILICSAGVACSATPTDDGVFKVALLTPGPISDQSWNAAAYAGLLRIRDSLGATVSHIQTKTPAEYQENFRHYGSQRYALAIGHGFEFQDAAVDVGRDFPGTVFITTGGGRTGPNVAALSFAFEEPSFLAGMVAASNSQSGIIACVGGTELPPVRAAFDAFAAGARAVNPAVRVVTSYLGTWDDAGAGKEQALALIGRGADVIFQDADAAGLGVFQAARESKTVLVIGSNANQNGVAPEITLGSVVIDIPHAFLLVAREIKERRFTSRVIRLDTHARVVAWIANPAHASVATASQRRAVDSVQALMTAGTFAFAGARE